MDTDVSISFMMVLLVFKGGAGQPKPPRREGHSAAIW